VVKYSDANYTMCAVLKERLHHIGDGCSCGRPVEERVTSFAGALPLISVLTFG
jgi:hypothetical protein